MPRPSPSRPSRLCQVEESLEIAANDYLVDLKKDAKQSSRAPECQSQT